ncbi:hypothetical protein EVAR_91012_1 [Eumeta japonica]|uniref:Uncharacterized protein n=1 Tax=Eumeta variegata TaxID=151549 RepID=A0A4C1T863_EUMVA|nr:hypothetical protein EVAR_91012_1 [Eumeta japonica]
MILLNDGAPTHFSTRSTFTHIDLSFASADIFPLLGWCVDQHLHGIIPIPKPNKEPSSITGYRPISLISCTSKVLEKIVATRLSWFLTRNKLAAIEQVAFKRGKGTVDALTYINHLRMPTIELRFDTFIAHFIQKIFFPTEQHLLGRIQNISSQLPLRYPSTARMALNVAPNGYRTVLPKTLYPSRTAMEA